MGPWSPNWRPDPTGRRLAAIRLARWGGWLSVLLFTPLVALAAGMSPDGTIPVGRKGEIEQPMAALVVALFCAPGVALLGAGLAGSAVGSRSEAAISGLAMAVGVPVAAVASALIGAFVLVAFADGVGLATRALGDVVRSGVTAAVRISPLIAIAAAAWVLLLRRFART